MQLASVPKLLTCSGTPWHLGIDEEEGRVIVSRGEFQLRKDFTQVSM